MTSACTVHAGWTRVVGRLADRRAAVVPACSRRAGCVVDDDGRRSRRRPASVSAAGVTVSPGGQASAESAAVIGRPSACATRAAIAAGSVGPSGQVGRGDGVDGRVAVGGERDRHGRQWPPAAVAASRPRRSRPYPATVVGAAAAPGSRQLICASSSISSGSMTTVTGCRCGRPVRAPAARDRVDRPSAISPARSSSRNGSLSRQPVRAVEQRPEPADLFGGRRRGDRDQVGLDPADLGRRGTCAVRRRVGRQIDRVDAALAQAHAAGFADRAGRELVAQLEPRNAPRSSRCTSSSTSDWVRLASAGGPGGRASSSSALWRMIGESRTPRS